MAVATSSSTSGWCQQILNSLAASARRAADHSRLQGLSRRYLDDAGVTPGELDAALDHFGFIGRREPTTILTHSV